MHKATVCWALYNLKEALPVDEFHFNLWQVLIECLKAQLVLVL